MSGTTGDEATSARSLASLRLPLTCGFKAPAALPASGLTS